MGSEAARRLDHDLGEAPPDDDRGGDALLEGDRVAEAPLDGDRVGEALLEGDRVGAGIRRWRREFPEIDSSGKAVVGRLLHLNEIFLAAINKALARHGLKYPAFAVLATLRVEGAPYRMSPKALLDTLILTSGGLSNLLRRLEKAGYVRRMADESDGRGVIVELTEEGRRVVEPAMRDHAATEQRLTAILSATDRRAVERGLALMMTGRS